MREAGTLIDFASLYWVIPIGFKKSSSRTSPGATGSMFLMTSPFVVIDDLNLVGISVTPSEADSPLIVDPDAMLASTAALQGFQPIARRHTQEVQRRRGIHLNQFSQCDPQQIRWKPPGGHAVEKSFRFLVGKALDHGLAISTKVSCNSTFQN
jgi:hypothetical protein